MIPEDLRYTPEHEWVRVDPDGSLVFGVTDYAQDALGEIVELTLPEVGDELVAGESCGELESTKSVSDVYAPVDGTVVEVNAALGGAPETVNADPYGEGWLVRVALSGELAAEDLLDAAAYARRVAELER